jgi:uncharacterized protein YbjT (DUF2867 family)
VTAATGHVGGYAVQELLRLGHNVRAMGRDHARLKDLEAAGAEIFVGDLLDPGYVTAAFTGVDGAVLIVPPQPAAADFEGFQHQVAEVYSASAAAAGLKYAAFVSVQGANDNRVDALVRGHANIEWHLNKTPGLNVVHVQPPSFFEILYYFLEPMRDRGVVSSPLGPDAALHLVSGRDVAAAAAHVLDGLHFRGTSIFPVYPIRTVTLREISGILAESLGRPVGVEQITAAADIGELLASGTGLSFATLLNDTWALATMMGTAPADGPLPPTTARHTIEEFIRDELVPAIRSGQPISDYTTAVRPKATV